MIGNEVLEGVNFAITSQQGVIQVSFAGLTSHWLQRSGKKEKAWLMVS